MTKEQLHDLYRYYGRVQGAECECGHVFYPISGSHQNQLRAFTEHRFLVGAGALPEGWTNSSRLGARRQPQQPA